MSQSTSSNAVVAQPAGQVAAQTATIDQEESGSPLPLNGTPCTPGNADSAAENDGEDKTTTPPSTESDGSEPYQTREEWDADDAEETDDDEYDQHLPPHRPTHLCVPGVRRRRHGWPRLSGPGFYLYHHEPSDAATTPTTDPAIPQLLLTTDEGEQFSLWDPRRYEYDFYHGRFHFYCLDTEDDEAAAEEEERLRAEYDRRCADDQAVDGVGDDGRTSTEAAGNVPDNTQAVSSPDSNRYEESRPCIVNGSW